MSKCDKTREQKELERKQRGYTYSTWKAMLTRCNDPEHNSFQWYGKRGIQVCERWQSFQNFLDDMGLRPNRGMTIDRLDSAKGYEPGNCRWATWAEQVATRTPAKTQVMLEFRGKTQSLSQWARELGLTSGALSKRIRTGWSVERALTTPLASHPARESEK